MGMLTFSMPLNPPGKARAKAGLWNSVHTTAKYLVHQYKARLVIRIEAKLESVSLFSLHTLNLS